MQHSIFIDCKEIKHVNPKGNQLWIFIGRTDTEAEAPIFWLPKMKNQLIRKDPNAGKDWRQEEKGMSEDEMVGWHHRLNGHEFEWTPGTWWWTGRPGVLQFIESQRIRHHWATELNWTDSLTWGVLTSKICWVFKHKKIVSLSIFEGFVWFIWIFFFVEV